MKHTVWVLNFYEEEFHLYDTKEKAIQAVEHSYKLVWNEDTAEGFHRHENPEEAALSIYPKDVL